MSPPSFHHVSPNVPVARASFHRPAAIPKAPIVNPYEKFTQPQFDAWIGDITGALRGALGYRAEPPPKPKARTQWHIPAPRRSEAPDATDDDADAGLDDSFAEMRARRTVAENGKGKGRDPREGPGLGGKGDRGAPIEIDLDSEDEEEEEQAEEEEWDEEEEGMQTSDEEEEEENALRNGESSARADARYRRYADRREDEAEDEDYEDGDAHDLDAEEVISDEEGDGERDLNGLPLQDGDGSGEEYSDEEDANPTSLLVAPHQSNRIPERDYSDEGEGETGSESEDEAATGSSPAAQSHLNESRYVSNNPRYADDMLAEEEEFDGAAERAEPEFIEIESDDEDEEEEEEEDPLREDDEFVQEDDQQDHLHIHSPPHIPQAEHAVDEDDDILPGSSPILSSPVEPEHSFPPEHDDVFDIDELKEGREEAQDRTSSTESKPFDWDHPPAFGHGVPTSGPGHLATPVEDDDEYPQLETFETSDLLPTFKSLGQAQTELEGDALQFGKRANEAEQPFSSNMAQEYFVTEVGGDEQDPDNLEHIDAYTLSRSVSVDRQDFVVEESSMDYEPLDRGMSIDVVTVEGGKGDPAIAELDAENVNVLDIINNASIQGESQVPTPFLSRTISEDVRELEATLDPTLNQVGTGPQFPELQTVEHDGDESSFPMPVLADPSAPDPSAPQPPSTPPRVPMGLTLPGSPLVLSVVTTPSGQPTPVSLPVPASILKMPLQQGSSLFTPSSSAPATPDHSTRTDRDLATVSKASYFEMQNETPSIDQPQSIPDFSPHTYAVNDETAKESFQAANDDAMVEDPSADVNAVIEQIDCVQEEVPQTVVTEAELQQSKPIEKISTTLEEIDDEPLETIEEALPKGDESGTAQDEAALEPAVAPEADTSSHAEEIDDEVVVADASISAVPHVRGFSPREISPGLDPTEPLVKDSSLVLEVVDSSAPLTEHDEPMEQEGPPQSSGDEEKETCEDVTAPDTSDNDAGDGDGMALQYPSESDTQLHAEAGGGDEIALQHPPSDSNHGDIGDIAASSPAAGVEVEETMSVDAADTAIDFSEDSETDADGDDDPDYEDSLASSVSVLAEEADVAPTVDKQSEELAAEPVPNEGPSLPAQDSMMQQESKSPQESSGSPGTDVIISDPGVDLDGIDADADAPIGADGVETPDVLDLAVAKDEDKRAQEVPSSSPSEISVPEATSRPADESNDASVDSDTTPVADAPIKAGSPPAVSPALKRKREHLIEKPVLVSNNLGKVAESRLSRQANGKGKGKEKAKEEYADNDDASSASSASSAARMLDPGSRATSRASSVVSVRSTKSSAVAPELSPRVLPRVNSIIRATRPAPKLPPPPPPPQPPALMHAHSHNRALSHHHHPPPLSRQPTQQQRLLQRTPSRNNVNDEPSSPSTSSMPMPAPSARRAPPAAGSPVTRSNCRYHKITLPEDDEGGTRVSFLVPGCSLGDKELMDEEEIKDMGDATMEDSERMVKDLSSLHLKSYLMSTLRQLVGVDLLREQEVFYVPPPGEEPPRKVHRREQSKLRISSGGSFATEGAMSPRSPASSRPPTSVASSTASVQAWRRKRSDRGSPASWAQSQDESTDDDDIPRAKRIRGADGDIKAAEQEGIAAAASGSPLRTRRSRRLDKEAAEYKPDGPDVGDESSEEEETKRKKKKRGLKRGRQSEAGPSQDGGGEDRKTKKLKTHESIAES